MTLKFLTLTIMIVAVQGVPRVGYGFVSSHHQSGSPCQQPYSEQAANVEKAEKEEYLIRRVEFIGNAKTRDSILRRRILLQEGDRFYRRVLLKSIANVSKLKMIYPVRLRDVVVNLNDEEKLIDFAFCFRERAP